MDRRGFVGGVSLLCTGVISGCVSIDLGSSADTPTDRPETPTEIVRVFMTSQEEDMDPAVHSESKAFDYIFRQDIEPSLDYSPPKNLELEVGERGDEQTTVRVSYETSCDRDGDNCRTRVRDFILKREDGRWKLWDTRKVSGFRAPPTPITPDSES